MGFENFIVEESGTTVVVQVNRPKAFNALSSAVLSEFSTLLDDIIKRKQLKAMVLTGAGDKAFIAGADIAEMSNMSPAQALDFSRKGQLITQKIEGLGIPVIAAVNGFALGGGCEIALACDFIIASAGAVFGQPETCLGLIPGFGGAVRLAEYVGWPMARELIYTGKRIRADEALRLRLVNRVVEPAQLMPEALKTADEISANSSLAVKTVKAVMGKIRSEAGVAARLDVEARAFSSIFSSHDQREGTKAFLEKRKPQFKGQ